MEVTCSQCKKKLNVPDEKIPKDQAIRINCPKCKNKITIDSHITKQNETSSDAKSLTPFPNSVIIGSNHGYSILSKTPRLININPNPL